MVMDVVQFFREKAAGTAVEFAILCPLYLFLVLGMTAYGIYFGASHSVQQIAADTARVSVAGLDAAERQTLARRFVEAHAGGYVFIDAARVTVAAADNPADASQFDVTVSYDAGDLPIWNLLDRLKMPGQTITRSSTIRIGGL